MTLRSLMAPGPWWWRPVAFLLAFLALVAMSVGYTRHVQAESDARWCDLLATLQLVEMPASVRAALHRLSKEFDC